MTVAWRFPDAGIPSRLQTTNKELVETTLLDPRTPSQVRYAGSHLGLTFSEPPHQVFSESLGNLEGFAWRSGLPAAWDAASSKVFVPLPAPNPSHPVSTPPSSQPAPTLKLVINLSSSSATLLPPRRGAATGTTPLLQPLPALLVRDYNENGCCPLWRASKVKLFLALCFARSSLLSD